MATKTRRRDNAANGSTPPPPNRFDLDAPDTGQARRGRLPEIAVALLVITLFALAGAWFYVTSTSSQSVVALSNDVSRGQVIDRDDLRVVQVNSDDGINLLPREQAGLVIGQIALNDLSAGTLVTPDNFAAAATIEVGDGVVGLALDPGEYPTLSIRPGDIVQVVRTARQGAPSGEADEIIVDHAEVIDVGPIGVQNQLFISLVMETEDAAEVAGAGAQDRVRLIQVARN